MIKEDPIYSLLVDMAAAWNNRDLDSFMNGYLPGADTLLLVSGKEIHGFDAIFNHYKSIFDNLPEMPKLTFEILSREKDQEIARFELRYKLQNGDEQLTGISVMTLVKREACWRILKDYS